MRPFQISMLVLICATAALAQTTTEKKKFFKAARDGDLSIVKSFVEKDPAWVKTRDEKDHGATALHFAKTVDVASYLLEHGAELEALDHEHYGTPLRWAAGD